MVNGIKNGPLYFYKNREGKENLYVNLTDKCTNKCNFCEINYLSKEVNHSLKNPEIKDVSALVREIVMSSMRYLDSEKGKHELVFCGAGESMLEFEKMLEIAKGYKNNKFRLLPMRLNTNGQGLLIYAEKAKNDDIKLNDHTTIVDMISEAGIEKINISMNVAGIIDGQVDLEETSKLYAQVCKPSKKMLGINPELVFEYVAAFATACANHPKIDTGVSFMDHYVSKEGAEIMLKYLGLDDKVRLIMRHAENLDENGKKSNGKNGNGKK